MRQIIKIKSFHKSLLVIGIILLGGCTDFLEEVPTAELTTSADLTASEYGEALTIGAYRMLRLWTGGARDWGNSLPNTLEFPTGGALTVEPHAQFDKYQTNQVTGDLLDNFNNQWSNWYAGVQDCNLAIKLLPDVELPESVYQQYNAEARTLRAFYYFCIVRYWGDAVLITEPVTDIANSELGRTSLKQIYDEIIIPDLESALDYLPPGKSSDGRITADVCRAILADVYLTASGYPYQEVATDPQKKWCTDGGWSMQQYPVAAGADFLRKAKTQLDDLYGKYSLGTYQDLHDPSRNNTGEAIFQVQYATESGFNNEIIQRCLPLLSKISKADENGSFTPWIGYVKSYAPNDKRIQERQMFFSWDTNIDDPTDTVRFEPHLYKYYDAAAVKTINGSGLNWSHYRYGEILLMLTEVNWALRQLGESVTDTDIEKGINEIRARAELDPLSASNITLKDILSERAWELVFENKMLWDQRRTRKCLVYGDGKITAIEDFIGHQPAIFNFAFAPMNLLSPIPGNEMNNNAEIEQNAGYLPN
ncbi:MAG: RagB/SusD family nutrient uptake outer membrane protein [Saprospiraceae bacterium]|nr:RagB/SusD family nutrient uptake outer membrane protein [Saprospiraceae bacterium]